MKLVPKKIYLCMKDVAKIMSKIEPDAGWNSRKARDWLLYEKAAVKRRGRWYTTESRLRATFPEAFEGLAH